MLLLEIVCALIVLSWVALAWRRMPRPGRMLGRFVLLSVASCLAENTCIAFYHFYEYSPRWHLFVGQVPLLVVLIWPVVILSAWELVRQLQPQKRGKWWSVGLWSGALVLADASLMEPIAVRAGLWRWLEPGLFGVPPIGVLGWALFASACVAWFAWREEKNPSNDAEQGGKGVTGEENTEHDNPEQGGKGVTGEERGRKSWGGWFAGEAFVLLLAPLFTHLALLALWWGGLRYLQGTVPPWPVVGLAWALSLALSLSALRRQTRHRMDFLSLVSRIPAALFFFVLLLLHGRSEPALLAYAFAFAPPYLAITPWRPRP